MAFIGWFGPRGLASIVFVLVGIEALEEAGVSTGPLVPVVALTVLFSIILTTKDHGSDKDDLEGVVLNLTEVDRVFEG